MKSGVLIRHLVLPSLLNNSRKVLDLIKENFGTETYVSLMSQYFPPEIPIGEVCLNRKLTRLEKTESKIISFRWALITVSFRNFARRIKIRSRLGRRTEVAEERQ